MVYGLWTTLWTRTVMLVTCDRCGRSQEDVYCQVLDTGRDILYVCAECYVKEHEAQETE